MGAGAADTIAIAASGVAAPAPDVAFCAVDENPTTVVIGADLQVASRLAQQESTKFLATLATSDGQPFCAGCRVRANPLWLSTSLGNTGILIQTFSLAMSEESSEPCAEFFRPNSEEGHEVREGH